MKTSIAILGALALSVSLSIAEEAPAEKNHEGKKRPAPQKVFKKIDSDNSGSVNLAEFQATRRGQKNPERAAEIFQRIDENSSGDITFEEFVTAHKKRHAHGPNGERPPRKKGGKKHAKGDDNGDVTIE